MTISIIGQGYVGLVSATVFSSLGNNVYGIDVIKDKIDKLNQGTIPFFEPGLEEMVKVNIKAGRLKFTTDYNEAISKSEIIFICVGTPSKKNGEADLTYIFDSVKKVAENINGYKLIVCKSTVPVGTNKIIRKTINEKLVQLGKKIEFNTASCPEFLREGTAIHDTLNPDRIIIGVDSEKAKKLLLDLHQPIKTTFLVTNIETAEMIKYTANSFLATKISFANAISIICEKVGADVEQVMDGVGLDKRIGRNFLNPGVGYGGSCLPKDVKALIAVASNLGYDFRFLKEAEEVNNDMALRFINKVVQALGGKVKDKKIGVWGLAFKPDTDDMREAASIRILMPLADMGAKIFAYDLQAQENAKKIFNNKINYVNNPYQAVEKTDILLILTEWDEFKRIDLKKIKKAMVKPIICDGRNIFDPKMMKKLGFIYLSIGR